MNKLIFFCLALILALASSAPRSIAQTTATAPASFNVRQAAVEELKEAQKEIVSLAQAMPQEKYTWRPAEGVRSVSEVYLHVSAGNFGLGALAGIPAKPGFKFQGYEKSTTDKAQVIAQLNESFEYAENGISALSDADLQKAVNWRDYPTVGDVILHMVAHAHEHLGQSIAYARTNGVVPPWTAEQQQRISQAPRPPQK